MIRFLLLSIIVAGLETLFAADPAKPEAGNFADLKEMLAEVPPDVFPSLRNPPTMETAATKATDVLRAKVEGCMATLKLKTYKIEKESRRAQDKDGYRVDAEQGRFHEAGATFHTYLTVHFDLSENTKIAALKKGREITVTGKITLASIVAPGTPEFHIDLSDAKLNRSP